MKTTENISFLLTVFLQGSYDPSTINLICTSIPMPKPSVHTTMHRVSASNYETGDI